MEVILIISVAANIVALIAVFWVYKGMAIKVPKEEIEKIKQTFALEEEAVLRQTQEASKDIIHASEEESKHALQISDKFKNELQERINRELETNMSKAMEMVQDTTKDITEEYKKYLASIAEQQAGTLNSTVQRQMNTLSQITASVGESAKEQIQSLNGLIEKELSNVREQIGASVKEEVEQVRGEMKQYKEEKVKEIDKQIYQLVSEIAKESIGRALNTSEQQEIVLNSLEKAKAEKVFYE